VSKSFYKKIDKKNQNRFAPDCFNRFGRLSVRGVQTHDKKTDQPWCFFGLRGTNQPRRGPSCFFWSAPCRRLQFAASRVPFFPAGCPPHPPWSRFFVGCLPETTRPGHVFLWVHCFFAPGCGKKMQPWRVGEVAMGERAVQTILRKRHVANITRKNCEPCACAR
jgi:hypothetical protein